MIMNKRNIKNILLILFGAGIAFGVEAYLRHGHDILDFNSGHDNTTEKSVAPKPHTPNKPSKALQHKVHQVDKINDFVQSAEHAKEQKNNIINKSDRNKSLATTQNDVPMTKSKMKVYQDQVKNIHKLSTQMKSTITKYSKLNMRETKYLVTELGKAYRYFSWQMLKQIDKYSTFNQMQSLAYKLNNQHNPDNYTNTLIKAFKKLTPYSTVPPLKKIGCMYKKAVQVRAKQIYSTYHGELLKQFNQIEHNPGVSPKVQNKLLDNFYQAIPQVKQHQKPKLLTNKKTSTNKVKKNNSNNNTYKVLSHHDFHNYMSQVDSAFNKETQKADNYRNNYSRRFLNTKSHPVKLNNLDNILKSTTNFNKDKNKNNNK